jgi:hypothetical protein
MQEDHYGLPEHQGGIAVFRLRRNLLGGVEYRRA